jgi:hypothetical protein
MARRIAPVPKLTPRQKRVYAHLCRKIRFPLVYGHARGCYMAVNDALEELHGSESSHPGLSIAIDDLVSKRACSLLHDLDIQSVRHLVECEWEDLLEDMEQHKLYDVMVGVEVHRVRSRYTDGGKRPTK